ncbi:poly(A) RNA polymerase, mitochondrial [Condylostylus longicornis]|uniref:poly(A) RNA polymerase, mitochondrial n=1 Tax=Condylostylus longicornis TaxID=2530218 RepID=UPI00244DB896|nr:poly(A) RNA polymerase, mitochondrial [Condylostylus longicornis]
MYFTYTNSIWRNLKNFIHENSVIRRKFSSEVKQEVKFDNFIEFRRAQASRSILVQVQSENSYVDLCNYCSKFGDIIGAHHYELKDNSNYILIEYKTLESIKEVLDSAHYNLESTGIPAYSPLLWFKAAGVVKGNSVKLLNDSNKKGILKISNGLYQTREADVMELILSAENVSDQIKTLHELTKLNDLEIRLRFLAAKQIENSISGIFPKASALPFGSSVNGFGKMGCDLDLVLRFNQGIVKDNINSRLVFHTKENLTNERSQVQKQMECISDILQIFLPGITSVRRILQARVPIIKFHHLLLNLDVDLTMSNMSGVYMSELLYILGEIDHRIRSLIFVIRKWAQSVGLTNPSPGRWITNFSLSCLAIFFLQNVKHPLLPPIDLLNKSATINDIRITENGLNCTFLRDHSILDFRTENNSELSELLLQFFEFFSQFDFSNKAISMNKGSAIIKPDHSSIYIVNPLEPNLNISKNISLEECERFRIEVRNAAWILDNEIENAKSNSKSTTKLWGIANLFKTSQETVIKPNFFFKPRMVEIKNLFDDKDEEKVISDENDHLNIKESVKTLETNLTKKFKINKTSDR